MNLRQQTVQHHIEGSRQPSEPLNKAAWVLEEASLCLPCTDAPRTQEALFGGDHE
ncbi:MAG: hypothetical protein QGI79_04135 [Dehalococcoidia bacterium]|nr:hypothetical protein [Dehalococcoidia bacterium]MDP7469987.1 hypothetical protein [Dehalococcoidia bacterium]